MPSARLPWLCGTCRTATWVGILASGIGTCAHAQALTCGLTSPAFCEDFEAGPAPAIYQGRAGDADIRRFSATRFAPVGQTQPGGYTFGIEEGLLGTVPGYTATCRAGAAVNPMPPFDMMICEPSALAGSQHLLTAVAQRNYGMTAFRIRQPFDFAGRTGRIVFDADLSSPGGQGWPAIAIASDATPVPSYALYERSPNLRNGILIDFEICGFDGISDRARAKLRVFSDFAESIITTDRCVRVRYGHLNHTEVRISQQHLEVLASDSSDDGLAFPALQSLYSGNIDTPFTRGYVSLIAHNHATTKYPLQVSVNPPVIIPINTIYSWNVIWDNVGFDGPRLDQYREYEIPDALVPYTFTNEAGLLRSGRKVGYLIPDGSQTPMVPLLFRGVTLASATRAQLIFVAYYQGDTQYFGPGTAESYVLRYRLNGNAWHERSLTPAEIAMMRGEQQYGGINHAIDVPLSDLVSGDNTVEFATTNVTNSFGFSSAVLSVDLIVQSISGPIFREGFE